MEQTSPKPKMLLSILNQALLTTDTLPDEDAHYVFECLLSSKPTVVEAAATLLVDMKKDHILTVLKKLDTYSDATQRVIVIVACLTDYVEVFSFLLTKFESLQNKEWLHFMTICLSHTDYFIYPILMPRLYTDDVSVKHRYHTLFSKMRFSRIEPYLAMLPSIPHERFFRSVFGNSRIDRVKST